MKTKILLITFLLFLGCSSFAHGGTLSGLLLDSDTNGPIQSASVNISGSTSATWSLTAPAGLFSISLPEGVYRLEASAPDYLPYTSTAISVPTSGTLFEDIYLDYNPPTGFLEGVVSSAETSDTTIEATIWLPDFGKPFIAKEGHFKQELPAGKQQLIACAFGYEKHVETVIIPNGGVKEIQISLKKAVLKGSVCGKVVDAKTGETVEAKVRVLDSPIAATKTHLGRFEMSLPVGTHRLAITTFGYAHKILDEVNVQYGKVFECDVRLKAIPPILVVDDDGGKSYERVFVKALEDIGKKHDLIDVASYGSLKYEDIACYETLVWLTGASNKDTLTKEEQAIVNEYLQSGGSLFLSGQNIADDLQQSNFIKEILGCTYSKTAIGLNRVSGPLGNYRLKNQGNPDVIQPIGEGKELLKYDGFGFNLGTAAVKNKKVVFTAFGLGGIYKSEKRTEFLALVLKELEPNNRERISRLELFRNEEQAYRWSNTLHTRLSKLSEEELDDLIGWASNRERRLLLAVKRYKIAQ